MQDMLLTDRAVKACPPSHEPIVQSIKTLALNPAVTSIPMQSVTIPTNGQWRTYSYQDAVFIDEGYIIRVLHNQGNYIMVRVALTVAN